MALWYLQTNTLVKTLVAKTMVQQYSQQMIEIMIIAVDYRSNIHSNFTETIQNSLKDGQQMIEIIGLLLQ